MYIFYRNNFHFIWLYIIVIQLFKFTWKLINIEINKKITLYILFLKSILEKEHEYLLNKALIGLYYSDDMYHLIRVTKIIAKNLTDVYSFNTFR